MERIYYNISAWETLFGAQDNTLIFQIFRALGKGVLFSEKTFVYFLDCL